MILAKRAAGIKASPTLEITAKAKAMKAKGVDIISFAAGEPDFDTPERIKKAAVDAIRDGHTRYTPVSGIDLLKHEIIKKLDRDNSVSYSPDEIIVSCGAKHTLYNISQALFEKGDEVIIPSPYWVSYPDQILIAGASPVIAETDEDTGFMMTEDILCRHITNKTKAVIINSPSNPTGAAYSKDVLESICNVAVSNNILIVSDEIYEHITYDGFRHISPASLSEDIKNNTIIVNGVSKAYSMTGWRIGYAAGNRDIVSAMNKIQSQSTSNPSSISQYASVEALKGSQDELKLMVCEFQKRRDYIVNRLDSMEGISCLCPKGAFYVFPNISALLSKTYKGQSISNSVKLASFLLEEASVAVVPGAAFGADNFIRLSFATSLESIKKGLSRIDAAFKMLA